MAHVFSLWSQAKAAGAGANDFFKIAEFAKNIEFVGYFNLYP
jgi:hypothetical protein